MVLALSLSMSPRANTYCLHCSTYYYTQKVYACSHPDQPCKNEAKERNIKSRLGVCNLCRGSRTLADKLCPFFSSVNEFSEYFLVSLTPILVYGNNPQRTNQMKRNDVSYHWYKSWMKRRNIPKRSQMMC